MKIRTHLASAAAVTITGAAALTPHSEAFAAPGESAPESLQHKSGNTPGPDDPVATHRPDDATIIKFQQFEETISDSFQPHGKHTPQTYGAGPYPYTFGSS
ncbi:hypothetical protein [uncultured Corynebacterium sp.]|uniref:hypothetical protein n=1 Tax=uncultured Corynebacterium sp. TaxID=159447 RepID=UPI0025D56CD1|nr:hypothetical protein [uncultured Corynebacterium sp.]